MSLLGNALVWAEVRKAHTTEQWECGGRDVLVIEITIGHQKGHSKKTGRLCPGCLGGSPAMLENGVCVGEGGVVVK